MTEKIKPFNNIDLIFERRFWINFEGSNVVHGVTGYDLGVNEQCPTCGTLINGIILERFKPVGHRYEPWANAHPHIRFIKEPTGKGKYRFCKRRGS